MGTTMKTANLLTKGMFACILAMAAGSPQTQAADSPANPSAVTAIDILLEPDAMMLRHSEANNARLLRSSRKVSPWMRRTVRTSR